jgi:hypothetical protein
MARSEAQAEYVQAREPATGSVKGEPFVLAKGEILAADHPIVKGYPHFFGPLQPGRQRVEAATAAPGERRGGAGG